MREERVEARLVDHDVEDRAAAGGNADGLDAGLEPGHVLVDPGPVEDRADDVEVGVEARAGRDNPEADGLAGVGRERMGDVLARVSVPGHPVRHDRVRLQGVVGRRLLEPRAVQVPLARDEHVLAIGRRQRLVGGLDDDGAVHAVGDVRQHRLRPAVVHEHAGIGRLEGVGDRLAGGDVPEGLVGRDPGRVEVDRVRNRPAVRERDPHLLTLADVDRGAGRAALKAPGAVLDAGRDLHDDVLQRQLDVDDVSLGNGRKLGRERLAGRNELVRILGRLAGVAHEAVDVGGRSRRVRGRPARVLRGRLGVVLRLAGDVRRDHGGGRPDQRGEA